MPEEPIYANRSEAGHVLAEKLIELKGRKDVVVVGLVRGGVPVAFEVAQALDAPLDVMVVRKLGIPGHEELAFGAIASGGHRVVMAEMLSGLNLSQACVDEIIVREGVELERRSKLYNGTSPHLSLCGRTVVLVDDGLATGATMEVAVKAVDAQRPTEIIVAAPVAPAASCEGFKNLKHVRCVFANTVEPFYAVGLYYHDFAETPDKIVIDLLAKARTSREEKPKAAPFGG